MEGVVNILVRQVKGDDLAVAGVNANVQLAPSAALCRAMFFKQPFAGPAQFQSRTVDGPVIGPLTDKRGAAFLLSFRPMDRALPVEDFKPGFKVALVHRVKRLLLRVVLNAVDRVKLGGSMFGFQDIEQAAPLDAGKLLIVARANDLCAAPGGVAE